MKTNYIDIVQRSPGPAADETELIVVRHGETEWNRQGRLQGHMDSPLTELGRQQAEALAKRLTGEPFSAVYSSDLGRAMATAERIARRSGHVVHPEPGLRECNLGIFQGLTAGELAGRHPEAWARYRRGDPDFRIPGGESGRSYFQKVLDAVERIAAGHRGERVVVVAHGGVLDVLFRHAAGLPLEAPCRWRHANGCLCRFFASPAGWEIGTWCEVGHLAGLQTA